MKNEILKKGIGILIVLLAMPHGVLCIAASNILYSIIVLVINAYPSQKLIDYKIRNQIADLLPALISGTTMAAVVFLVGLLSLPMLAKILIQICVGVIVYLFVSAWLCKDSMKYVLEIMRRFIYRR